MNNVKTNFTFYLAQKDSPFFGAYKVQSLNDGEPVIWFNMDANIEAVKDEPKGKKAELFNDLILQTVVHEFAHAMQEWLGKTYSENEVEDIVIAFNEKWKVIEEPEEEEDRGSNIRSHDLLDWLEDLPEDVNVKEAIFKMLGAEDNWRQAYKERKQAKENSV